MRGRSVAAVSKKGAGGLGRSLAPFSVNFGLFWVGFLGRSVALQADRATKAAGSEPTQSYFGVGPGRNPAELARNPNREPRNPNRGASRGWGFWARGGVSGQRGGFLTEPTRNPNRAHRGWRRRARVARARPPSASFQRPETPTFSQKPQPFLLSACPNATITAGSPQRHTRFTNSAHPLR